MVAQWVWGGGQKYPENRGQIVMWLLMRKISLVVEQKIYEERQPKKFRDKPLFRAVVEF